MQNLCAFHNLLYNPSKSTNVFTWQTFRPLRKKFQYECTKRVNSQLILDTGQRVRTSGPFSVNKNPFNIRLSMQIKIIICIINKKNVYIYRYWHFALYPQNISTPNIKYKHWETYQKGHHRKSREPITPPLHYLGPFLVAVRHPDGANCWVGHSLHLILRMVITALIGNHSNGYINPYSWVDNHLLYHGNPRETWISLGASYNPYIAALKLRHFPCFFFFSGPSVSWCFVVPSPILTNMPIVKVAIISRNGRYKQNDWNHRVQVESDDCHWIILSRNWM